VDRFLLFLPGPMQVPDTVAEAAKRPLFFHRSSHYEEFRFKLVSRVQPLFGTTSDVLFLGASATGAMESAVVNMTSSGEEVIVVVGGIFAERWVKIATAYGLTVRTAEVDWRSGPELKDVLAAMKRWPNASVVFITWSESSTGVLAEMDQIGKAVRERDKFLVVDAVSGLAVSPMEMDLWSLDVVVVGSQKGLMVPPGLALVAIGPRAWERNKGASMQRYYWDWSPYRTEVPVTPPLSLMFQLEAALDLIDSIGPDGIYQRRALVAARIREMLGRKGLEIYAKRPSNGITAVIAPNSMDVERFCQRLEEDYSISIAGGQGSLKGKIFRIGHVGQVTDEEIQYFMASFEKVLEIEMRLGSS